MSMANGPSFTDGEEEEEYIEDYSGGTVSSRAAYADNARLRGANTEDAAAADAARATTVSNAVSDASAAVAEPRVLQSQGYHSEYYSVYGPGYSESEGDDSDDSAYGNVGEGDEGGYDDAYSGEYEYEYEDGYLDEYEAFRYADDDERGIWSNTFAAARGQGAMQQLGGGVSALPSRESMEGRVLQLLEGAFALAYGSKDTAATASQGRAVKVDSAAASASSTTAADSTAASSVRSSDATTAASSSSSVVASDASEFGYDTYDLLDRADRLAGLNTMDDDDMYFGYEYDLYGDYYTAMTVADVLLSKFDIDRDEDEWADYLEQAYEYFAFYMDEGDEYLGSLYATDASFATDASTTSAHGPSAIEALASIAELVVWAHMGNFVLEVRPAFTISQLSEDGSFVESDSVFLISSESYGSAEAAAYAAAALALADEELELALQMQLGVQPQDVAAPVEVVNVMSLRWVLPDGRLNWGLVSLTILSAATAAMLVGCVVSWMGLRRTMMASSQGWVYRPAGKRCAGGKGEGWSWGKGGGCENGYDAPLVLRPEDCKGAVCWAAAQSVEDASEYVSPKLANESVAKALYK